MSDMVERKVEPYSPFPSFGDFSAAVGVNLSSFNAVAETFAALRASTGAEELERAVATATRWAAVDTGAIEGLYSVDRGFTMSVAASAAALDNAHLVVGEDVVRAIQDAIRGYEFVLDVAAANREPSEQWIKELHAVLCASQGTYRVLTDNGPEDRPLVKGTYKELPNSPVNLETGIVHSYASPVDTAPEMQRLVDELRGSQFIEAHPILQAVYSHYGFVCVHPFPDGNGRVARALASTYLYRSPGVPLVVFVDQKGAYIDALEASDRGEFNELVAFVRERAIDTVLMVETDVRRPARPTPQTRLEHLNSVMRSDSGLLHTEIDALVARVRTAWEEALQRAIERAGVSAPITVAFSGQSPAAAANGYRIPDTQSQRLLLTLKSAAPATGAAQASFSFQVARPGAGLADFAIFRGKIEPVVDAHLRDVQPTISQALTYRLDVIADDVVSDLVDKVVEAGEESLRKAGYL